MELWLDRSKNIVNPECVVVLLCDADNFYHQPTGHITICGKDLNEKSYEVSPRVNLSALIYEKCPICFPK